MILAIIAIALQVVGLITGGEIWSVLVGCVLPVLYLIGALQNKKVA